MVIFKDEISIYDKGSLFGFGIFETLLVMEGKKVFLLDKHMDRLFSSLNFFDICPPFTKPQLIESVLGFIKSECTENTILRITVTSGNNDKGLPPSVYKTLRPHTVSKDVIKNGCKLNVSQYIQNDRSLLCMHKTSNYLLNHIISNVSSDNGYYDSLILNSRGLICETSRCNIFFVKDGYLFTPSTGSGILPGIIRTYLIETALNEGISIKEGEYSIDKLLCADEVFVTNSVIGILPVSFLSAFIDVSFEVGIITKRLMTLYNKDISRA